MKLYFNVIIINVLFWEIIFNILLNFFIVKLFLCLLFNYIIFILFLIFVKVSVMIYV